MAWPRRDGQARANQLGALAHTRQPPAAAAGPPSDLAWVEARAVVADCQV
jgi:hypothetical protein